MSASEHCLHKSARGTPSLAYHQDTDLMADLMTPNQWLTLGTVLFGAALFVLVVLLIYAFS